MAGDIVGVLEGIRDVVKATVGFGLETF